MIEGCFLFNYRCESDTVKLLQQASGGITLTIESSKIQKLDDNKEDTDDSETFNEVSEVHSHISSHTYDPFSFHISESA